MKTLLLTFFILITLLGCKPKLADDKLKEKLFTYFQVNLKESDSTLVLDSLRIIKFDTISQKDIVGGKETKIITARRINMDEEELLQIKISSNIKIMKLYNGLSNTLYEHYRDEAKDQLEDVRKLLNKDSLFAKEIDSLGSLYKKSDSTHLVFHQIECLRQFHRKDQTVKRDTVYAFMTPEKNLIKKDEMYQ